MSRISRVFTELGLVELNREFALHPTQMVFPLSAKAGTLLGWAQQQGLWEPLSLWSLVRLLADCASPSLEGGRSTNLSISWFDAEIGEVVRARPDGCDLCRPLLLGALTTFRARPVVSSLTEALKWRGCDCGSLADEAALRARGEGDFRKRLVGIARRWEADQASAAGRTTLPIL
ncbi:hypothetical protein [Streptomyces sp. NPDC085479]|uniref:hypothetical protein n=1 Tax=Streptomyces sp. NPDC085479 TaxID=3365726 RepID=UPI0037D6E3E6